MFGRAGIPVFDADQCSRRLVDEDLVVRLFITLSFGFPSIDFDRKDLATVVFSNPEKRKWLETKIHFLVFQLFDRWCQDMEKAGASIVVIDAPLIYETDKDKELDGTIAVIAPEDVRIKRVMARSGLSEAEVRARMVVQVTDEERRKRATYILENDSDLDTLRSRSLEILKYISIQGVPNA